VRFVFVSFLFFIAPLPSLAAEPFSARVVHVADGDTITVEAPGHIIRVRLAGIDCPETNQAAGDQATWFTNNIAMGRMVLVTEHDTDRSMAVWSPKLCCLMVAT
jgi:endonuclease YncB( thermonuclease family)